MPLSTQHRAWVHPRWYVFYCSICVYLCVYLLWLADEIGLGHEHYLRCSQRHLAPYFWYVVFPVGYVSTVG